MRDRQKIEAILARRFPGAPHHQVAAAVNAIMGLGEEWEEVVDYEAECAEPPWTDSRHVCHLAREFESEMQFRLFRRREH